MTRPIFEPSLARTDRKLGFSADQLFRRPAPTPAGRMWGVPDLLISGGAASATTGTNWPVPFPDYATPWTATGSAPVVIDDDDGELFNLAITDDGDAGNDRWEVTSRREGWWAADLLTQWDSPGTPGTNDIAAVRQRIDWTSAAGIAFSPTQFIDDDDWMIQGTYGTLDIVTFGFLDNSYLRTWMSPHYLPTNKTWRMQGLQRTGSTRDFSGIYMKFWFIKADDLSGWTFDSV